MAIAAPPDIETTAVAVIGAGPYGLSIAAHLSARGVPFRIFGEPMETWRAQMPRDMKLKSEGFASNLSDPTDEFSLRRFCEQRRIPYGDVGMPIERKTFADYGLAFAERFVPDLDTRKVALVERRQRGFLLTLADGARVLADRVVVAVGISHYAWLPPEFADVSGPSVTHTSMHHDFEAFRGRRVVVVGGGASAADVAALLVEAGVRTHLVARRSHIVFHDPPGGRRSLYARIRHPQSGLGPNLKAFIYSNFPDAFRLLPARRRAAIVRTALGPAACWFTKAQIVGNVQTHLGCTVESVDTSAEHVRLTIRDGGGFERVIEADHVIAGTGYRVDLRRLTFLPEAVRGGLRTIAGSPTLSRNFESTIPGLYFVGIPAAVTFGPLLRFAFGARFAAHRIARHLERVALSAPV